jgi:cytochrome c2
LAPEGGDIKSRREKPMKTTLAIAALAVAAMAQAVQAQDVAAGEQSFKKCFACHSMS